MPRAWARRSSASRAASSLAASASAWEPRWRASRRVSVMGLPYAQDGRVVEIPFGFALAEASRLWRQDRLRSVAPGGRRRYSESLRMTGRGGGGAVEGFADGR